MSQLLAFVRGKNWAAAPMCFGADIDHGSNDGFIEQKEATEAVAAFTGVITKTPRKTLMVWFNDKGQVPTHFVVTKCVAVTVTKKKPAATKKSKGRKLF